MHKMIIYRNELFARQMYTYRPLAILAWSMDTTHNELCTTRFI